MHSGGRTGCRERGRKLTADWDDIIQAKTNDPAPPPVCHIVGYSTDLYGGYGGGASLRGVELGRVAGIANGTDVRVDQGGTVTVTGTLFNAGNMDTPRFTVQVVVSTRANLTSATSVGTFGIEIASGRRLRYTTRVQVDVAPRAYYIGYIWAGSGCYAPIDSITEDYIVAQYLRAGIVRVELPPATTDPTDAEPTPSPTHPPAAPPTVPPTPTTATPRPSQPRPTSNSSGTAGPSASVTSTPHGDTSASSETPSNTAGRTVGIALGCTVGLLFLMAGSVLLKRRSRKAPGNAGSLGSRDTARDPAMAVDVERSGQPMTMNAAFIPEIPDYDTVQATPAASVEHTEPSSTQHSMDADYSLPTQKPGGGIADYHSADVNTAMFQVPAEVDVGSAFVTVCSDTHGRQGRRQPVRQDPRAATTDAAACIAPTSALPAACGTNRRAGVGSRLAQGTQDPAHPPGAGGAGGAGGAKGAIRKRADRKQSVYEGFGAPDDDGDVALPPLPVAGIAQNASPFYVNGHMGSSSRRDDTNC